MGMYWQQLKVMIRKNWLLKIRHPFITLSEVFLPVLVMLALIVVRTQVDTRIHPDQGYVDREHFVCVGKGGISPSFTEVLESLYRNGDYLAFAPYNNQTTTLIELLALKFPLLKEVSKFYKDEIDLETYIRSNVYGTCTEMKNCSYPKVKGAIVFHHQGPNLFDYSIRLNHSWAFSGFPDLKTIMDTNGPYLNDLELGVDNVPIFQYSLSAFLTLQQIMDSLIIVATQNGGFNNFFEEIKSSSAFSKRHTSFIQSWMKYSVSNIKLVPFPTREYTDDEFQSIIKTVMGILYILGFLYPVSRLISYTVFEKEQRIEENLYMMGLKKGIFHVSWFLIYVLQFAISSLIITACTTSTLFKYSDKTVVFTYFFSFGLSAITLSFVISTFFNRAKTAVAVGTLSFLGLFFPYYTISDVEVPMLWKVIASSLSPTAFALGLTNFADYERAHVGLHWSNIWRGSSGVNFLVCLLMLLFDTLLYCAIGCLLAKVHPENRLNHWWRFIFWKFPRRKSISLEWHSTGLKHKNSSFSSGEFVGGSGNFKPVVETISLDMKQQELDGRCIQIRNLHKVYFNRSGKCCAVNSLQLTLYENQILALLGHNGAGKSTTISMLVGLIPPTSGDAVVFGKNITRDMEEVRNFLGVCPQNDILFPELTVKEHLEIYATLKGVTEVALNDVVAEMIDQVGLTDKINTYVRALSGGMKRKLSLGIALIGNSKVIILDEPTSGMDPYSMRLTWQLIKKFKKGRIILLTTHSMDEADVLGDRIAIMANGSLKCCGSSLFLKHHYEVGYTLTLVKTAENSSFAADIVHRHIPSAICVSNVGNEVSFKLPLSSSLSFEGMFMELENHMDDNSSPFTDAYNIRDMSSIGIESYGISVTTLEEVFLRVAGPDTNEIGYLKNDEFPVLSDVPLSDPPPGYGYDLEEPLLSETRARHKYIMYSIVSASKIVFGISISTLSCVMKFICAHVLCSSMLMNSIFWRHFKALVTKRAISACRDMKTVVFQLGIPVVFLFFGLLFLKLKPHPDLTSLTFTTSFFNPLLTVVGGDDPIPYDMSWPISKQVAGYLKGGWVQVFKPSQYRFPDPEGSLKNAMDAAGPTLGPMLLSMSEFLMSSFNESYQSRYGAVVMDDEYSDGSVGYTILHNSTCQHSAPTFINLMNSALLRLTTLNDNMTIVTRNHPLPMTRTQRLQHHDLDAFSAAIVVSIAFSFIPSSFSVLIVKEREVKAKHQQIISGVSLFSYWSSTYAWDFISFIFPSSIAIFLFYIFDLDQFIGSDCFLSTLLLFCGYGFAVAPSTYCLTFFFCDHTKAQNVILLIHFFTGLVLMVISFIMGIVPSTVHANSMLKNVFRLSPGFCFADGLASLALMRQGLNHASSTWVYDWNITGASICYLFVEGIIYFIVVLVLELYPCQKIISSAIKRPLKYATKLLHSASKISLEEFLSYSEICASEPEDDIDVQLEKKRVLSDFTNNPLVCLQNLRKEYSVGMHQNVKVAVHSLSFSVQEGECFGFLGTNGAGKTTTLSMLSGEEIPTSGTAYVFGKNICSNPHAARINMGYCPQFNALLEYLTVQEHLELYARIKGIPDMDNVVMQKLREFDLVKHAHKPSFLLSGGNLRKLSVAIAMIGDPPIVILDEPSTGMDPISKRFMWEVISRLSTRRGKTAVILTTHSMSEAQALCTRIGIMVGGKLRCIGSSQHLKTRFGNHLELEVKPTEVSSVDTKRLCEMVYDRLLSLSCKPDGPEICISSINSSVLESMSISEISLSAEMIHVITIWLGNEERGEALMSCSSPVFDSLTEQISHGGGIPLMVFAEWWLTREKFSMMDSFVLSSFPGATCQGCNGLNVKYQLPYKGGVSLADIFGHLERNRKRVGIEEYSVGQSTLETIFNHFAANP